ncbi:MAG: DinB family protein [Balneolaceae bacterium]|nr:DinB family protein [Balneolaceae bacterium]MCH8549658.1 DinB family protein [Balneolaceae bacterium]
MDQRQNYQRLLCYDLWCTRKLCDLLTERDHFQNRPAVTAFLAHIVNVQEYWFERVIQFPDMDTDRWEEYPPDEIRVRAKEAHQKWIDLIGDHEVALETEIYFETEKGVNRKASISRICRHLVEHGEHHRAQILLFLRNCDINTPLKDFSGYSRLAAS